LAVLLSIALAGGLIWAKKKKEPSHAELDGQGREMVYEVDGYVKPSEMEAKELQAVHAAPTIHEMSSEQQLRKDP
jgi:hypothetical protein